MIIKNTKINEVKVIDSEPFKDERGFLNRIFCQDELNEIQPNMVIKQINHSMTSQKGTVRGLHFQNPPYAELKIIRCIKGSIFDVAVDLRRDSHTFLKWHREILSEDNMKALVIPEGFAHGFQSLEDDVEMIYLHTNSYCKEAEGSLRYDDPKMGIDWQIEVSNVSKKDMSSEFISNDYKGVLI
ncbi:MAG: dTDP-4-dehydrorhamnose 3,5-epimerase [Methanobrevibacter sp.]|jgi:dTDP-4-dehydrorhamnose 3,5-epimerase|nr:dTDP-4-dehydrorhamnose 3,5-epimerase [Candidatus Methanovirga aequatorialis]